MNIGMVAASGDMLVPEPRLMRYELALFDCAAASAAKNTIQDRILDTAFLFRENPAWQRKPDEKRSRF
jgi:hypothetical protein